METMKAIARRKSTRAYKQDQIPDDVLNSILAAGCAAPVGMGKYDSLHLTVIQNKEILKDISAGVAKAINMDTDPLYGAPTVVLVSSKGAAMPGIDYANTGCILENMMLAATDKGISSVFLWGAAVCAGSDAELQKRLAVPEGFKPIGSVALGYSAEASDQAEKELTVKIGMNRV